MIQQSLPLQDTLPQSFWDAWNEEERAHGEWRSSVSVVAGVNVNGRWSILLSVDGRRVGVIHRETLKECARDLFLRAHPVH